MTYRHTQHGKLYIPLLILAVVCILPVIWFMDPTALWIAVSVSLILMLVAGCFSTLTVEDDGEYLKLRYGPISLVSKRIPYGSIYEIHESKTSWIDGWGIHYVPLRGWTYNVWGFDCVRLKTASGTIRIGTNDPHGLAEFLRHRLEPVGTEQR